MLTTTKITTGEFTVQWNGQPSGYRIVNGSLGLSGRDTLNMYGVVRAGQPNALIFAINSAGSTGLVM